VILRSFNELLRRLSRAEEAVFCGRVFIFLFQSFPLGARSSVNFKGEFHTDNVTTFDEDVHAPEGSEMVIDPKESTSISDLQPTDKPSITEPSSSTNEDTLYPIFWTLQQVFSNPPALFKQSVFTDFRKGLDATLLKFKEVPIVSQRAAESQPGLKRKAAEMEQEGELANTFNPKYLTSRDLFSLEVRLDINCLIILTVLVERLGIPKTHTGPSFDTARFPTLTYRQGQEEACTHHHTKSIAI
jgi:THO complex subunit 1